MVTATARWGTVDMRPHCGIGPLAARRGEGSGFFTRPDVWDSHRAPTVHGASWRSIGSLPPPSLLREPVSLGGHRLSCCLPYTPPTDGDHLVRPRLLPPEGSRVDRHCRSLPAQHGLRGGQARRRPADHLARPPGPRLHAVDHRRPDADPPRRVRVPRRAGQRRAHLPRRRARDAARRERRLRLRDRRRAHRPPRRPWATC